MSSHQSAYNLRIRRFNQFHNTDDLWGTLIYHNYSLYEKIVNEKWENKN